MKNQYTFHSTLWLYPGKAGWCFVTVPKDISKEISHLYADHKRGFGSLKVSVTIGSTTWKTSIFPDSKIQSYLLPIKAEVRNIEHLNINDTLTLTIEVIL